MIYSNGITTFGYNGTGSCSIVSCRDLECVELCIAPPLHVDEAMLRCVGNFKLLLKGKKISTGIFIM
jgi:hypothetical protein